MRGEFIKLACQVSAMALCVMVAAACSSAKAANDPFQWLEQLNSGRAQAWVAAENAKTLGVLHADPRYADNLAQAQAIGNSADRIPAPSIINGQIYNFWQDATHVRGIWRKTSIADYETAQPHWNTVLDLDALAKTEGRNWVWAGADCSPITETHCLVALSDGGADAQTLREFDLTTDRFVTDGFVLPLGKQSAEWLDDNTVLVAREWRPGEVTTSGYPYIVKRWRRGRPLDAAVEVSRGSKSGVSADLEVYVDADGQRLALIEQSPSFFEHDYRIVTGSGSVPLALPPKSAPAGLVGGRILVTLDQNWAGVKAGSLVALDLNATLRDPQHLHPTPVFTPGPLDALRGVTATRDHVIVTSLHNVRGRAAIYTPQANGSWSAAPVPLPDNATITATTADTHGALAYLTVTSFLTPPTLWHLDTATGLVAAVKTMPPQFDSSQDVVEQQEATSPDGTKVPYFVVHRAGLRMDGSNPTILYAYGGFGEAETPFYSGALGKLWLDHGGVYVLANIRGGGEFGPAWHDAALTTHRQRAFDDFAAVGRDLVARKITSPRRLGIQGGSNGGLLMGVEFTQHPELWNAVDMQVPLLDMLRYQQIDAGSSWVGEYGSVDNPTQRAFLASISPYQQLRRGVKYPTPFIWTTTTDDRVGPQHARKFAAKLASFGDPYLFYESSEGGHGAGDNIGERATIAALEYTYFMRQLM